MTETKGESPENPIDNSTEWVAEHIREFDDPKGADWPTQRGAPLLLLTSKGAKSGLWRRTALIYGEDNGNFVIVASKGGAPKAPGWFLNLIENPEVHVQVRNRKFVAMARTATPDEKPTLWNQMVGIWPDYANYQERTNRDIPVVILKPVDSGLT